ncbi:hypothetical protein CN491_19260 [Bacillus cereus]|uniref:Uncharacterized protein n=1 Tax=Bacillus cereus TaxID=1396 RepID=A0A2A8LL92_BACCE|nr:MULTISPECIES: hypothetical protein [Bacillus cereus group]MEA1008203.1 hypothetical protein [Bacillus cereus]PES93878.1 hypothetical protein CN491_19260 [Bacillus cereus]PFP83069.1 hypothetical protein COJ95_02400 [Bacillus cereus]PGT18183.1 hypothetical protein COC96_12565 [Bacillus cereus]
MKWKREDIIFETMREAEVWADSIANEMYGRVFDGYETLDYKIAYVLSFFLAQEREWIVHTEKHFEKDRVIYKVWVTVVEGMNL